MAEPKKLAKAELHEITWDDKQQVQVLDKVVKVQFNPETLKLAFANQKAGGDQRGGSATQFVGQGTTKLTFELWFDMTAAEIHAPTGTGAEDAIKKNDVRLLTKEVIYFITPKQENDKYKAPGVRFLWGTFLFDGTMDSLNENLEFFSEDGRPLRASVSISLSKQEIKFEYNDQAAPGLGTTKAPGTAPLDQAKSGDTLQSMAGDAGRQNNWQDIANANDIDNPRQLGAGALVNMRADLQASASAGISVSGSAGGSISGSASGGFGFGASADAGASLGGSAGLGGSFGGSASASAGFGGSAGASAGFGGSAGASAGFGGSASASAGFGGSAGAGAGISGSANAGAGYGGGGGSAQAGIIGRIGGRP